MASLASPIARRGPTGFLLVHGLSGTPTELHYLAQQLEKEGHTVYCPLLDGHGGGTRALRASRWQDWYASVERAHEKLQSVCETVIVGGSSAGGILSLILAARRPDQVSGLLLYAPTLRLDGWAIPRSFSLFKLVTQRWVAHFFHFSDIEPYGIKDERVRKLAFAAMQSWYRWCAADDRFSRYHRVGIPLADTRGTPHHEQGARANVDRPPSRRRFQQPGWCPVHPTAAGLAGGNIGARR